MDAANKTERKFWYLNQINLFEGIPKEELMSIAEQMFDKECAKKEVLYTPFEVTDSIYILKRGEVTLYHSREGRKLIIDVLHPGSFFGNISFESKQNTHFAEVTEDALICLLPVSDFKKIVKERPEMMLRLIQVMSDKLGDYEERIKSSLFDAKDKVLHHLRIIEEKGKKSILGRLLAGRKKITHEQLSQHSGLSRETVTRVINDLKKEGKITTSKEGNMHVVA